MIPKNKLFRIAVDGPGGAGKSTLAKALAEIYGIDYVDTGAMYRAVALKIQKLGLPFAEGELLTRTLEQTVIDFVDGKVLLDGVNVSDAIRTGSAGMAASAASALPSVRRKLVAMQRKMGLSKSIVMDGRDIGTNVLPQAEFKFFLTASPEVRAKRRLDELLAKGENTTFEKVLADMKKRDLEDSTRKLDPLKPAQDAYILDTSSLDIASSIARIREIIESPQGKIPVV